MSIQPDAVHSDTQLIFHPAYLGHVWAEIGTDGSEIFPSGSEVPPYENTVFANIVSAMKRGLYTTAAYNVRCVANIRKKIGKKSKPGKREKPKVLALVAKRSDRSTLGELFAPKKSRGNQSGLRTISERDRYKGKVDWEAERPRITEWLNSGVSLSGIAKRLDVSPGALSKANKTHGLYERRNRVGS